MQLLVTSSKTGCPEQLAVLVDHFQRIIQGAVNQCQWSVKEDLAGSLPILDAMLCCAVHCICHSLATDFDRFDASSIVFHQVSWEDDTVSCHKLNGGKDSDVW